MRMVTPERIHYEVIIIGGGPAGCAAAIRLAGAGLRVLLLEEKRMPRPKLCGEFITPESFPTLRRLGVFDRLIESGAERLTELRLSACGKEVIRAPIAAMSNEEAWAMSLSRARFDQLLFERAREAGALCLEGMAVKQRSIEDGAERVQALSLADGREYEFKSALVIDASGRNSRLMVGRSERVGGRRGSRLYAMKVHLSGVEEIKHQVELYFFNEGYGGLSRVEGGLVNLCFIANERTMREAGGDPLEVMRRSILKNALASERLAGAEVVDKWLSTGPLTFGTRRLARGRVIAAGDASGMIDPFTGTGIQIALRTGELAAESIIETLGGCARPELSRNGLSERDLAGEACASNFAREAIRSYEARYHDEFGKRMRVAGVLRRAAFSPLGVDLLARLFSLAPGLARFVLKATRAGRPGSKEAQSL